MRYIVLLCILFSIARPTFACDKPANGEGFSYVVRGASFLYDFTQEPPMAYGELAVEVTNTKPITQVCIICEKKAVKDKLTYAMLGSVSVPTPKRLAALDTRVGKRTPKGKLMEYVMPLDPVAPKMKIRVYVQVPIEDLTAYQLGQDRRLVTTAPSFMVPCDMIAVRILPPKGYRFLPDESRDPQVQNATKVYRLRGTPEGAGAMDNAIVHALYVLGREEDTLPEGGYYIKTLKPQERFPVAGKMVSVQAESTRRSLMFGGALLAMIAVALVLQRIAKTSSANRLKAESTRE